MTRSVNVNGPKECQLEVRENFMPEPSIGFYSLSFSANIKFDNGTRLENQKITIIDNEVTCSLQAGSKVKAMISHDSGSNWFLHKIVKTINDI